MFGTRALAGDGPIPAWQRDRAAGKPPPGVRQHQLSHLAHPRHLRAGARVAFTARFVGRNLDYVYEFVQLVPGRNS